VGLSNLLHRALKDIHLRSVGNEIVTHKTGLRLLLSSYRPRETDLEQAVPQMEAILRNLTSMCNTLILDLGSGFRPYLHAMCQGSDLILMVVEPIYPSNIIARALVDELETRGVTRHKMSAALVTRERTSLQLPWRQVTTDIGLEKAGIISPAPELAHQASQTGTPLIVLHPASLVSDQLHNLAEFITTYLQPL
jgi:MinD-like ATPase involved in chromosome partitioning or flagellar assembly